MTNEDNHYIAAEGCFLVRKEDNFIMGEDLYLGDIDSIDNYEDQAFTDESYVKFYHDLGLKTPKEMQEEFEQKVNE